MAQISIYISNQLVKNINLTRPVYILGRDKHCDIQLQERTVSKQHARLSGTGKDFFLEDMNSMNGIYVNDTLQKKHLLVSEDIIRIGKYCLLFKQSTDEPLQSPDLVTQIRRISLSQQDLQQTLKKKHQRDLTPILTILNGQQQGKHISLQRGRLALGPRWSEKVTIERNQKGEYLLHTDTNAVLKRITKLRNKDCFTIEGIEMMFHNL